MKREVFKKIISEWLERDLPEMIERDIEFRIDKDSILAIMGPRRAGKTYLMFNKIKQLLETNEKDEILFIDFEDNRLAGISDDELDDMFTAHKELSDNDVKYLFFDEIQEIDKWSRFVRRLNNLKKYYIVISGSSSKLMSKEIATELRGRYRSILLLNFSFKEFLRYRGFEYKKTTEYTANKGKLMRLFDEYMLYGGYPEIIKKNSEIEKKELANSYFDTTYYKDVVERHRIKNTEIIELLMSYLIDINSDIFSISSFEKSLRGKGIKVSKKTISQYLKYLEEAFFVFATEKFSYSGRVRIQNPKKVYLSDNVFHTMLSTTLTKNKGKLLESLAMQEFKRKGFDVFYFKHAKECDFILQKNRKLTSAVQVTYDLNEKNKKREMDGLVEAMSELKIKEGMILTYDQEDSLKYKGYKIRVAPLWKFLLSEMLH